MEGWMEIKTGLKEKYFVDRFKKTSSELADTFATDHTLQILASRLTDLFATIIICVIVFWSVYFQTNYQQTLILLAVYVGASFRLLPSINRILNSLIQIKSHEHLLTNLKMKDSVKSIPSEDQAQSNFQNEISLESVSFSYPQRSILFEELSFRIKKGEKIAITGRSGGGKTSLLLLLLGILRPSKGKISIDDRLVTDLRNYQSLFSYVSQSPYVLDASIKENVAFGISSERIDREKVLRSLKQVDLQEFVEHLPLQEDTQLGERGILLSGGQRQRLALARALYADREVLILDEVTNQLDRETEEEVIQSLQKIVQMNRTLIMVTHHQQLLSIFDRIVKLENGKLVELSKEQRQ
jgi:ABC-type bacteriocin/lantibiotic exporter with double-glycine peptidase domain